MMNNFVNSMIMKFGLRLSNFLKCQWHRNICVYIMILYIDLKRGALILKRFNTYMKRAFYAACFHG